MQAQVQSHYIQTQEKLDRVIATFARLHLLAIDADDEAKIRDYAIALRYFALHRHERAELDSLDSDYLSLIEDEYSLEILDNYE